MNVGVECQIEHAEITAIIIGWFHKKGSTVTVQSVAEPNQLSLDSSLKWSINSEIHFIF